MPPHPLEIPEILALVGFFLPLWEETYLYDSWTITFELAPQTLCHCLLVSKLWHTTLLPILWSGLWADLSMDRVPNKVISRHSHLFQTLHFHRENQRRDFRLFKNCTNLVELRVFHDDKKYRRTDEAAGSGKQLLRANPRLKVLGWEGDEPWFVPLDVEDLAGFTHLERLSLDGWDCSGGRLGQVLRLLAGTLRKLSIKSLEGLRPEELLQQTPTPHSQSQQDSSDRDGALVLDHLDSLTVDKFSEPIDLYLYELVKHCPSLTSLQLCLDDTTLDTTLLANCLQTNCPNLNSLCLPLPLQARHIKALVRHSSRNGLRRLRFCVHGPEHGLVSAIITHAPTLESLCISKADDTMDPEEYLRYLVDCTRLKRFTLSHIFPLSFNLLELWGRQTWGCRDLEDMSINITIPREERLQHYAETEARTEEVLSILSDMGWEHIYRFYTREEIRRLMTNGTRLRQILELFRVQQLDKIRKMELNHLGFRPVTGRRL
ncbi:hypothetical protein KI688_000748 [Linnemannia hyalina]|uniref:F-box domain-containing protein n=1 Tax=Linnemannia hyalina TaxID=64524 RepID=A0A9P7Y6A5_9FUNG|nr:hypothetical protein KI688_000748 [Linnemannia hyalina]